MDDTSSLNQFLHEMNAYGEAEPVLAHVPARGPAIALPPIGQVLEIAGSGSQVSMSVAALAALLESSDPSLAMSG